MTCPDCGGALHAETTAAYRALRCWSCWRLVWPDAAQMCELQLREHPWRREPLPAGESTGEWWKRLPLGGEG